MMARATREPIRGNCCLPRKCDLTEGKMSESNLTIETAKTGHELKTEKTKPTEKLAWETPKLEDVSEQVMAQPYIRFT
jgi:hypothetical protein